MKTILLLMLISVSVSAQRDTKMEARMSKDVYSAVLVKIYREDVAKPYQWRSDGMAAMWCGEPSDIGLRLVMQKYENILSRITAPAERTINETYLPEFVDETDYLTLRLALFSGEAWIAEGWVFRRADGSDFKVMILCLQDAYCLAYFPW